MVACGACGKQVEDLAAHVFYNQETNVMLENLGGRTFQFHAIHPIFCACCFDHYNMLLNQFIQLKHEDQMKLLDTQNFTLQPQVQPD